MWATTCRGLEWTTPIIVHPVTKEAAPGTWFQLYKGIYTTYIRTLEYIRIWLAITGEVILSMYIYVWYAVDKVHGAKMSCNQLSLILLCIRLRSIRTLSKAYWWASTTSWLAVITGDITPKPACCNTVTVLSKLGTRSHHPIDWQPVIASPVITNNRWQSHRQLFRPCRGSSVWCTDGCVWMTALPMPLQPMKYCPPSPPTPQVLLANLLSM